MVAMAFASAAAAPAPTAAAATCPTRVEPADFTSSASLRAFNAQLERLGPRPTASEAQARYIAALERRMRRLHGVRVRSLPYAIDRWDHRSTRLELDGTALPVAGPVPYARPAEARGALLEVPRGQPIGPEAAGRIVVRDATPSAVPFSVFGPSLLGRFLHDPGDTLAGAPEFRRDFLDYDARMADLQAAADAGARGLLFLTDLPREQVRGQYAPYEGVRWRIPAAYLGADEGARVRAAMAAGAASARLTLRATTRREAPTRTLMATLPGRSDRRIVVESHTDGVNAIWDNGPIAMVAMARRLAALPRACRPRTIDFVFTTGHLFQRLDEPDERDGGAEQVAQLLDRDYDRGRVAAVVVVEHFGALEYGREPRPGGLPGSRLRRTGDRELLLVGVTESRALVEAVRRVVLRHDLRRTALLRGADVAGDHVPPHCSLGGEGTPYLRHLLPTVGAIAAPATLYHPAFGLEGIDFAHMRRQAIAFTELTMALGRIDARAIAGQVDEQRRRRAAGAPGCPERERPR